MFNCKSANGTKTFMGVLNLPSPPPNSPSYALNEEDISIVGDVIKTDGCKADQIVAQILLPDGLSPACTQVCFHKPGFQGLRYSGLKNIRRTGNYGSKVQLELAQAAINGENIANGQQPVLQSRQSTLQENRAAAAATAAAAAKAQAEAEAARLAARKRKSEEAIVVHDDDAERPLKSLSLRELIPNPSKTKIRLLKEPVLTQSLSY